MTRSPATSNPKRTRTALSEYQERFWGKVDKLPSGCWEWTAGKSDQGYGAFKMWGKQCVAHRLAYEWLVGPIPEDKQLDHLCRNTSCVNPAHLEPVTTRENVLRGVGTSAQNARATHCIYGHPFDDENTYWYPKGSRGCKACRLAYYVEHREEIIARATIWNKRHREQTIAA